MNSDFKELLQCLNKYKVRYLVIGGYAVIMHTEPRYTKDLDIWVDANKINASRLIKALKKFGAPTNSLVEADFAKPGTLFIFGIEPNRVDILNRIKKENFSAVFARRIKFKIEGVTFNCIALPDLIRLKKRAGRAQDNLDIEKLTKVRRMKK